MYELYDPCTVMFFFRNKHIMIDLGTGNNNKINWALEDKQEMVDIVETVYRGARKGRGLVISPKDYSTKYRYWVWTIVSGALLSDEDNRACHQRDLQRVWSYCYRPYAKNPQWTSPYRLSTEMLFSSPYTPLILSSFSFLIIFSLFLRAYLWANKTVLFEVLFRLFDSRPHPAEIQSHSF